MTFEPVSRQTLDMASKSTVAVATRDDGGFGQGALVDARHVLTAWHLFRHTRPERVLIMHPLNGQRAEVENFFEFSSHDLCLLVLKTAFEGPTLPIERPENIRAGMPVALPYLTQRLIPDEQRIEQVYAGRLGHFNALGTVMRTNASIRTSCGLSLGEMFRLTSITGESGGAIVNAGGRLVSILSGGDARTSSGPGCAYINEKIAPLLAEPDFGYC